MVLELMEEASEFIDKFRKSRNMSIDRWLSFNPHYKEIGKLAIANSIVKHENHDRLRFEGKDKSPDWFTFLFNEMIGGSPRPEHFMMQKGIFITFNYDRVLEHLFYESFKNTFSDLPNHEVDRILSSFGASIIHVYGTIDEPPWKKGGSTYGKDYNLSYLNKARTGIRIINERTNDHGIEAIPWRHQRDLIFAAVNTIFFLGFGYDSDNMRMLEIPNYPEKGPAIYGTAHGLLPEEIYQVSHKELSVKIGSVEACDCTMLLRKYLYRAMV